LISARHLSANDYEICRDVAIKTGSRLITHADGTADGVIRQGAKTNDSLDSPGNIFVFDQKLPGED
jgi:hypothetical protein